MSKTTLAIIAGVSAATGAAVSAAFLSTRRDRDTTTLQPTPTTAIPSSTTSTTPAVPVSIPLSRKDSITPVNPSGLFQYGFPGPISDLRPTLSTTFAFDRRTRNPAWVAEHITPASLLANNGDRKHSTFVEDESIPSKFRAKLHDYFRSGYDRGHQVPAADAKWSQAALDQTFLRV